MSTVSTGESNKKCQGYCPNCGSGYIEWLDSGPDDDYYYYNGVCEDCGQRLTEWCRIDYAETTWTPGDIDHGLREAKELRKRQVRECNTKTVNAWLDLIRNELSEYLSTTQRQLATQFCLALQENATRFLYNAEFDQWLVDNKMIPGDDEGAQVMTRLRRKQCERLINEA